MNFLRGFSLNAFCTGFTFSLGLVNHWLLANYLGKTEYGRLTLWTNAAMIGAILLGEWLRRGCLVRVNPCAGGRPVICPGARDAWRHEHPH